MTEYQVIGLAVMCLGALVLCHMAMWIVHHRLRVREREHMLQEFRDEYQELMTGFTLIITNPNDFTYVYHHIENIETRMVEGTDHYRLTMKRAGDTGKVVVGLVSGDVIDFRGVKYEPF
jgi:hypothetical protein